MPYNPPAYDSLMGATKRLDTYFTVSNKHFSCDYERLVESVVKLPTSYTEKARSKATELRKGQANTIMLLNESLEKNVSSKKQKKMILIGALLFRFMRIVDEYDNNGTKLLGWLGANKKGAWHTHLGQCITACLNLNSSMQSDAHILSQIDVYTQYTCLKALRDYLFEPNSPGVLRKGINIFDSKPTEYYSFLAKKISYLEPQCRRTMRVFERIRFVQSLAQRFDTLIEQTSELEKQMKSNLPFKEDADVTRFIQNLVKTKQLSSIFEVSHPTEQSYPIDDEKKLSIYIDDLKKDMERILSYGLSGAYLIIREIDITGSSNTSLPPLLTKPLWDTIDKSIALTESNAFDDKESKWKAFYFLAKLLTDYLPQEEVKKIDVKCATNLDTLLVKIKDLSPAEEDVIEERRVNQEKSKAYL